MTSSTLRERWGCCVRGEGRRSVASQPPRGFPCRYRGFRASNPRGSLGQGARPASPRGRPGSAAPVTPVRPAAATW
jgi:hypothetical protein